MNPINKSKQHLTPAVIIIIPIIFFFFFGLNVYTYNKKSNNYTALVGVTIIDGTGNPPLTKQIILIKGAIIQEIAPEDSFKFPLNTIKINLQGKYVIPGLIDMHAHVTVLGLNEKGGLTESIDKQASIQSLKTFLAFGITTVRNPAAPTADGIHLREAVKSGQLTGPDIYTSGSALNSVNGNFGPFVAVKTQEQVKREIRKQAKMRVDIIKVYAGLKPDLIKIAIDEAHKHNLKVIGHLQNTSWTEAAELGIDFITHAAPWHVSYLPQNLRNNYRPSMKGRLFWLENTDFKSETIQHMLNIIKVKNISIDPTLIAFHTKFWGDNPIHTQNPELKIVHPTILNIWNRTSFVKDWKPEDFKRAKAQWQKLLSLTRLMYQKGILITAGSDFPNPWALPGIGLHDELELLHSAGIPPLEVIKIATLNGAKALGIEKHTGSITKGKAADLVVLNNNPLENIKNTRKVHLVFKQGKKYDPDSLLNETLKNNSKERKED